MTTIDRPTQYITPHWEEFGNNTYECRVWLIPDDESGFTAIAAKLPGVVSEGDTIDEALSNIKDAFRESIRSYLDDGEEIPWGKVESESDNAFQRWVLVNV